VYFYAICKANCVCFVACDAIAKVRSFEISIIPSYNIWLAIISVYNILTQELTTTHRAGWQKIDMKILEYIVVGTT
jgi:hypothetical protein